MFEFTKEQEMLRAMVREFADTELAPRALELDEKGEFPFDIVKKLGQLGIIGMALPKEFGGAAIGYLAATIAIEELARVYPSIAFFTMVSQVPMYAIENFGTEEQKKKYLPPVIRGEKIICIAATEATGGSDIANLGTEAVADDDGYTINGRKVMITNGGVTDYTVLLAKTGDRASMFLVEKGTPGFTVGRREEEMGFKSLHVSELVFNDCKVARGNLIGKEGSGFSIAMTAISHNRASIGAIGLGIARGAFEIALKYSKERILYGKPISNLQAIQFMLVDMETEIEAAKWLIYYPRVAMDRGLSPREIGKHLSRAKVVGTEAALNVTKNAIEILGAYGLSSEYHLARLLNDTMELFAAAGTNQILKVIQAGEILK